MTMVNKQDEDTNQSKFLDKLGCRKPQMQISVRNVPQMDDDDDPQTADLYYQIAAYSDTNKNKGYHAQPLKKNGTASNGVFLRRNRKSEIIKINKNTDNHQKWIDFEPVDSVMNTHHCAFGCGENENWAKMMLMIWDSDDNHIFSTDDKVADFYFGYGDEVFVDEQPGLFISKNDCQLNRNEDQQLNRGFYEGGRYEVAWCMKNGDWKEALQVKLNFYCE